MKCKIILAVSILALAACSNYRSYVNDFTQFVRNSTVYESSINTFSDPVSSRELERAFHLTVDETTKLLRRPPVMYRYVDLMGNPYVSAVWFDSGMYCSVTAASGNDSDVLWWVVSEEDFEVSSLGVDIEEINSVDYFLPFGNR